VRTAFAGALQPDILHHRLENEIPSRADPSVSRKSDLQGHIIVKPLQHCARFAVLMIADTTLIAQRLPPLRIRTLRQLVARYATFSRFTHVSKKDNLASLLFTLIPNGHVGRRCDSGLQSFYGGPTELSVCFSTRVRSA
jgi:hypothetical protein